MAKGGNNLIDADDETRHEVRIAAKKLRYAAEFFGSLYTGGKACRQHRRFLDAIETLQDLLGELNDMVTGPDVLAKLGIDATLPHSGKRRRKRLLEMAEEAHDALMKAKRFWRA